ncbi:MAG TPA: SGNH/GDSL hydrolase family protein [Gemmatimonadales bacterium]|nr:SGNH/GDSL hydrolase family protein [Gemmatimonadales bacterium]
MMRTNRSSVVLGLLLAAAACQNDELNRPYSVTPVDPLFDRYVSMGNSITAGFQSAGINDSTQSQSYAVLLARAMHAPFFSPLMKRPGCPPPFTNVFTGTRLTPPGFPPSTATSCYLRSVPNPPPPYVSNTAVPGAEVADLYNNFIFAPDTNANVLTSFFLGGLTQTQMMERANPTFVSVWIGNNDVLGAATASPNAGDSTQITSVANFQTRYGALLDTIQEAGPRGVVLLGVANVTLVPYFSRGAVYWAIKNGLVPGAAFPPAFTVSNNCAPVATLIPGARGDSVLVPFPYGAALLGAAQQGAPRNLDCADTVAAVIVPSELIKLIGAMTQYNAYISSQATARGWAYLDVNVKFAQLAQDTAQVRPFPYFPQGNAGDTVAVRRPFGKAFSLDGIHASASTHRLLADTLRHVINSAYGTAIPAIP